MPTLPAPARGSAPLTSIPPLQETLPTTKTNTDPAIAGDPDVANASRASEEAAKAGPLCDAGRPSLESLLSERFSAQPMEAPPFRPPRLRRSGR